jgi:hypothetical protein
MSIMTTIALVGATGFVGLGLGSEGGDVAGALARECERVETVAVAPPRTPLATQTEVHMRCTGVLREGRVADADFLIADGRLRMIELRGPDVPAWVAGVAGGDPEAWASYDVYRDDGIVLNKSEGRAWLLNADALRSYAFLQPNPFAVAFGPEEAASAALPSELALGAAFEEIATPFTGTCTSHAIRELDPADHPLKPESHVQIDCYGYPYLGFPRLIEAVFADGELTHVWILTTAREEARVRAALVDEYGEAVRGGDAFEIYGDGTVVLRKDDSPEVLFMSESMVGLLAPDAAEQGG